MTFPVTINRDAFEVIFAPTSPVFADRMKDVIAGRLDLLQAQRENALEGFLMGEIVHTMKGWAVINRQSSLGGMTWFTPFAQSREIAMIAAEAWYNEDRARRELIRRKRDLGSID